MQTQALIRRKEALSCKQMHNMYVYGQKFIQTPGKGEFFNNDE